MITVPILFAFNDKLLVPAIVCLTSLVENANADTFYDIFVLQQPGNDSSRLLLRQFEENYKNCRITLRIVDNAFIGAYEVRGISIETYFRLIAPELIPEYGKILYSDVDVIIREDLRSFYEIELGDNYFAGVDNGSALRPGVREHLKEIGLDYRKGYFYAGNIVINSQKILKDDKISQFKELAKNNYPQQDMDILNIACNGKVLPLPPSFCMTNFLYELMVDRKDDMVRLYGNDEIDHALKYGIVHYNGPKPWIQDCLNMDIWWQYYRRSIVFDEKFCLDFWQGRTNQFDRMSLVKRLKHVIRYFLK